ncbi:MAG: DUF3120 domain-containing protein [cyanobacterium endosymbiont of Rhopalodia musculus]
MYWGWLHWESLIHLSIESIEVSVSIWDSSVLGVR